MQPIRWMVAVMALGAAAPAAADVYRFGDGVVRVRHGRSAAAPRQSAKAPALARSTVTTAYVMAAPADQPAVENASAALLLDQAAAQAGLHPALLEALVWQESRWRPDAVSPKGAVGLTQLMPGTARELGVDPRDPTANLFGGARHLRKLIDHFDGDVVKALAAYNAGVRRVEQAGGVPPIAETQRYVLGILGRINATSRQR